MTSLMFVEKKETFLLSSNGIRRFKNLDLFERSPQNYLIPQRVSILALSSALALTSESHSLMLIPLSELILIHFRYF